MKWKLTNKYFKTDTVFHEDIIGFIEDSVYANPNFTQEFKDRLVNMIYSEFYHADYCPDNANVINLI